MKRIIIMLAGALLATTAHAQQTPATIDDVSRIVDVAVTKLTNALAAQPKGRRVAMYRNTFDYGDQKAVGSLELVGSAIDGITHTNTDVTLPAGTYLLTLQLLSNAGMYLYEGFGYPSTPIAAERINTTYGFLSGNGGSSYFSRSALRSYTTATRVYVGKETERSNASTFDLTIERLD